jgi:hypothetical protein
LLHAFLVSPWALHVSKPTTTTVIIIIIIIIIIIRNKKKCEKTLAECHTSS